jgi:hypothetical protein
MKRITSQTKAEEVEIGDEIYVESHFYLSHGEDDVVGGLARITDIECHPERSYNRIFITVAEHPGHSYNLDLLLKEQENLAKEFGESRAYADPDLCPEFNEA